jgi:Domain of unknown function (DUF4129)
VARLTGSRAVPVVLVVVAAALAVAAVGLAGRPSLHLPRHEGADPHAARDIALVLTTAVLGAVLIWQARRLRVGYQRLTYRLVGICLIAGPLLVVNVNRVVKSVLPNATRSATPTPGTTVGLSAPPTTTPSPAGRLLGPRQHLGSWPAITSAILTAAALALLGVIAFRLMRRPGLHVGTAPADEPEPDRDDVLRSATAAITLGPDPRGRVIAAYEAMESALLGTGSPRAAATAPLEWLAGLAQSRPFAVEPARDLTEIFERARFSTAPITDSDADRARALLEGLRATLTARRT